MSRPVILKGDTTSHKGVVLEGTEKMYYQGRGVALVGHLVYCPLCLGSFPIVEGSVAMRHQQPIALEGMKTACGAVLIASQKKFTAEG